MAELTAWLAQDREIHPLLVAGIAQFQLVDIHPFLDGNGRTARLLCALCLYRSAYDFKQLFTISESYDRDRPAYYRALQEAREHDFDLTGSLEYFTSGLATQLGEIQSKGEKFIRLDLATLRHGLSERQKKALVRTGGGEGHLRNTGLRKDIRQGIEADATAGVEGALKKWECSGFRELPGIGLIHGETNSDFALRHFATSFCDMPYREISTTASAATSRTGRCFPSTS